MFSFFFFFNDTATTEIYTVYNTLSLHDALPISVPSSPSEAADSPGAYCSGNTRSEEHTSELQSLYTISYAVFCLKKKNKNKKNTTSELFTLQTSNTQKKLTS